MKRNVKMSIVPKEKLSIEDLVLNTDKNQEKVKKVIFQAAGIGDISWTATKQSDYIKKDGFKIAGAKVKEKPGLDELPQVLYELRDRLLQGPVNVMAEYRQWDYGDRVSYTFTTEQINDMEIVEAPKKGKKKK